jgi:hypothetical protein
MHAGTTTDAPSLLEASEEYDHLEAELRAVLRDIENILDSRVRHCRELEEKKSLIADGERQCDEAEVLVSVQTVPFLREQL